jgi:long-chain acyl-CoA synthetase
VLDDIGALRPTLFCGVPRVFDRIYAGIQDQLKANPVKRLFFALAFAWKSYWMKLGWRVEKVGGK